MKYLLIFLALVSMEVFSVGPAETGTVTQLLVHRSPTNNTDSGRRFIVKLSGSISNGVCDTGDSWNGYFSDEVGKAQYSTLLAASIAGIEVIIEGTEGYCENNTALIRNVYVKH